MVKPRLASRHKTQNIFTIVIITNSRVCPTTAIDCCPNRVLQQVVYRHPADPGGCPLLFHVLRHGVHRVGYVHIAYLFLNRGYYIVIFIYCFCPISNQIFMLTTRFKRITCFILN